MKVLFCNIAWMQYYKGIYLGIDEPLNGGEFVKKTGDAHEKYNFYKDPTEDGEKCLGYFATKSSNGVSGNQLHIEKFKDVEKSENQVDDVLVIWCATHINENRTVIVGWYKNATVYRNYQEKVFTNADGSEYSQFYNVVANAEDCVLLPALARSRYTLWNVPRRRKGCSYGFSSANYWFATEEAAKLYVSEKVKLINNYAGENDLEVYPVLTEDVES